MILVLAEAARNSSNATAKYRETQISQRGLLLRKRVFGFHRSLPLETGILLRFRLQALPLHAQACQGQPSEQILVILCTRGGNLGPLWFDAAVSLRSESAHTVCLDIGLLQRRIGTHCQSPSRARHRILLYRRNPCIHRKSWLTLCGCRGPHGLP